VSKAQSEQLSRQLSPIRGLDKCHFDYLAGVLFHPDFTVYKACMIPSRLITETARESEHVNGAIIHLRESWWNAAGVQDRGGERVDRHAQARTLDGLTFPATSVCPSENS
jgi:hypothetical protein